MESKRPNASIYPASEIVVLIPTDIKEIARGVLEVVEKDAPEIGKVIAVGAGKQPVVIKVGDIVAYRRFGESRFTLSGQQTLFVKFEDILAVIKTKEEK